MALSKFDKATCNRMSDDMRKALEGVAAKYGVKLVMGNGKFNPAEFSKKLSFKVMGEDGIDVAAKRDFELYCRSYGLKPEMFGQSFNDGLSRLIIVGFNSKARKNVIQLQDTNGKKFVAPASYVLRYMK